MNRKFIFISKEGKTKAPNEDVHIQNMQVIGIIENVLNEDEAYKKLLQENPWIWNSGFNVAEFMVYELR